MRCSRRLPPDPGPDKLCKRCTSRDSSGGISQAAAPVAEPVAAQAPALTPAPAAATPSNPQTPSAKATTGDSASCNRCSRRLPPDPDVPGLCKRCSGKSTPAASTPSHPAPAAAQPAKTVPTQSAGAMWDDCTRCSRRLPGGCTTGLCRRCTSGHEREPRAESSKVRIRHH